MDNTAFTNEDIKLMKMALKLAERARGETSPNPLVGAVIVKDGIIAGKGYHKKAGEKHAEIIALEKAGNKAKGGTLYINLEPCCHKGKTPPCTEKIIASGIKKVICSMKDPNPLVFGKGIKKLKEAGIDVLTGLLEKEAIKLNEVFIKYITTGLPFLTLKAAISLDGKIATSTGSSKWITNELSRKYVNKIRYFNDAIMVGINTILKDNPSLTLKQNRQRKKNLKRIIVDSKGKIPLSAKVLTDFSKANTIIACTNKIPKKKKLRLEQTGAEIMIIKGENNRVNLIKLLKAIGRKGISSVLLEGGGKLNASAIKNRLVDKILVFIAPKIIGGKNAPGFVAGQGIKKIDSALPLSYSRSRWFGDDILLEYYMDTFKNL